MEFNLLTEKELLELSESVEIEEDARIIDFYLQQIKKTRELKESYDAQMYLG